MSSDTVDVLPAEVWTGAGKDFAVAQGAALLARGSTGVWSQVPEHASMLGEPSYLGVTTRSNVYKYTDSNYACQGSGTYIDNIDMAFTILDAMAH